MTTTYVAGEKNKNMEEKFKEALLEAANWTDYLTKEERMNISSSLAQERVLERIFEKYKDIFEK